MDLKRLGTISALTLFAFAMFGVVCADLSTGVFQPGEGIFITKDQSPYGFWIFTFARLLLGIAAGWWAYQVAKQKS